VDVIISSAASIEFDISLHDMIAVDYFGPVKMLDFAKECRRKPVFHHVSTAYVNSNKPDKTFIDEKIHPYLGPIDFEKKIEMIMQMDPNTLA
jgi:fatty acyl-CoA reductase